MGPYTHYPLKTIRKKNVFPISHERVDPGCMYVFVILNQVAAPAQYFVVPGEILKGERERFSRWFWDEKFPGINWRVFADEGFENAWHYFDR